MWHVALAMALGPARANWSLKVLQILHYTQHACSMGPVHYHSPILRVDHSSPPRSVGATWGLIWIWKFDLRQPLTIKWLVSRHVNSTSS